MKVSIKDIIESTHSFEYYKSDTSQILIINLPNTLRVKITVSNDVFEWFVDIYNSKGELLISNWYDHYDDNEEHLIKEMRESIIVFVNEIVSNKTRLIVEKKFLSEVTVFQTFKDKVWTEYFRKSKFKI